MFTNTPTNVYESLYDPKQVNNDNTMVQKGSNIAKNDQNCGCGCGFGIENIAVRSKKTAENSCNRPGMCLNTPPKTSRTNLIQGMSRSKWPEMAQNSKNTLSH